MIGTVPHRPVLLQEVLTALSPKDGAVLVDGTFGAGGYTKALLEAARCVVYAIDRDPDAIAAGQELVRRFPGRLILLQGRFAEMDRLLHGRGLAAVDGVALDVGVSSMQLDRPERGFSFRQDGPLDMRMEQSGPSAADLVNRMSEGELADMIYRLGEDRASRRIARAIVRARAETPILRTAQLAAIVAQVVRPGPGIHPATRTFQALRIYVNDELEQLRHGLAAAERLLKPGGRLAVVSFHSLEDRLVKQFLQQRSADAPRPSRHAPSGTSDGAAPSFKLVRRGGVKPGNAEIAVNPRARSARLRAAERTAAPAFPLPEAA